MREANRLVHNPTLLRAANQQGWHRPSFRTADERVWTNGSPGDLVTLGAAVAVFRPGRARLRAQARRHRDGPEVRARWFVRRDPW